MLILANNLQLLLEMVVLCRFRRWPVGINLDA